MKLEYECGEKCSISKENSPAAVKRERERESCMYSCGGGKHPDIDASHNLTELSMGQQHVRNSIGVLTGVRIRFIMKQPNQDIRIIPGGNNINNHHMECLRLCERMYVS